MKLDKETFLKVIDSTPLVAIDFIIENDDKKILLGKRLNKPAQAYWFVPGGRIRKNETIQTAFNRILKTELGLEWDFNKAKLHGAYDHIYEDNFASEKDINTHYVVIAYKLNLNGDQLLHFDEQHSELRWMSETELMEDKQVHANTKNYL